MLAIVIIAVINIKAQFFDKFSSVAQLCLTLCDPMNCSRADLPVSHHLLKFAQVPVHCISDAIQASYPLMPSSPLALSLSQHQGLIQ